MSLFEASKSQNNIGFKNNLGLKKSLALKEILGLQKNLPKVILGSKNIYGTKKI